MGKGGSLSGDGIIRNATLIAGPTASGKSAMALDIAEREDGIIVNADSMQVYSMLDLAHRAADGGRSAARAARALRPCPSLYRLFDRRVAARRLAHRRRGSARRAAADLRRRHRPLFPGAGRRHFAGCRRSRTTCATAGASGCTTAGRRNCTAFCSATIPRQRCLLKPGDGQRIVRALEVLEARAGRSSHGRRRRRHAADRPRQRAVHRHRARPAASSSSASRRGSRGWSSEGAIEEVKALLALDARPGAAGHESDRRARARHGDRRPDIARPKRSVWRRSRRANMPSASRPGSATSSVRNGNDVTAPFSLIFQIANATKLIVAIGHDVLVSSGRLAC